jgi:mannose-6-phosphate isomerase-like protein (cupin superfamily)
MRDRETVILLNMQNEFAIEAVNIEAKLTLFSEQFQPKIVGQVNDMHVMLVKVQGEFIWHHHEKEDELFLVIAGELTMQLRDKPDVVVRPGEFIVVPRGVEHRPCATVETHIMLLEPATTVNTGNAGGDLTAQPEWI